ncbi:hypothetical protein ACQEUU_36895 [Nonomuraea sp. CA-218870]|uniref:hypothetical protein n=1 Tax=Nonomuraea sp. CA-218870 TaxID=3239998 RepID=UPI003D9313E3
MGHQARQPASTLTRGASEPKHHPATITLTASAIFAWLAVGHTLATGAEDRWVIAAVGAASSLLLAAAVVFGTTRLEAATRAHCEDMRQQVIDLNWLMQAKYAGETRAKIEARRAYGVLDIDPSDSGPFTALRKFG